MKRHALFVGVDQYADGHIPNLSCAVSDATDLHGFFKYGAGYDQVQLLPNPAGKKEILGTVRSLTSGLGPGDFFLFFFAGHGFRVGENHVLVCSNDLYDDVKYEYDGLPLGQLKHRLSGTFNSALLLDACQSDILATRGGDGIAERDLSLIHAAPVCEMGGALTIVTSCDAGQTAAELSERRHGLFTVAMLDLLKEAQRAHFRIDLSDAFRMDLGRRMGEIAARFGLPTEQRPRFSCTGNSCFILLDGVVPTASATQPPPQYHQSVAPTFVICPVCGKKNHPEDTFRCRECGRDNLCLRHQDKAMYLCAECTAAQRKVREEAERKAKAEAREEALRNGTCREAGICRTFNLPGGAEMEMIYCPPGEFMMGSPANEEGQEGNETQHRVRLTKGFWLGKYPVTQRQWRSVMGGNPSYFKGDDLPVETVSWNDCQEFIKKVNAALGCGARLPTEAEWEYACRAGTTGAYGGTGNLDEMGWFCDNSGGATTHPVGQKKPNAWGLCDMHGNVWEWCADRYGGYSTGSVSDPQGPASGGRRVLRGGGWSSDARRCRSAGRLSDYPGFRYNSIGGFRLSCSAGPRGLRAEP